jgi:membrane associated rhomboid family serine protease
VYGRGYQSGGFGFGPSVTPPIIKQLLIANLAVFIAQHLIGHAMWAFAVVPYQFWQQGYFWQPFTYMWMHSPGSLMHIGFNMLALWMFGSPLAMVWGHRRFLRFYLVCGFGAGLLIATVPAIPVLFGVPYPTTYVLPTLGASGAVFGVLLAYSLTWPNRTIMLLFPPIPIRAIYFIPFILAWGWLLGPRNVSHVGHIGGVVVAWFVMRRQEGLPILPSGAQLRYRWRRWRMRRQLRAVRLEEERWRERSRFDDDRPLH